MHVLFIIFKLDLINKCKWQSYFVSFNSQVLSIKVASAAMAGILSLRLSISNVAR